jgi:hypothetical protein
MIPPIVRAEAKVLIHQRDCRQNFQQPALKFTGKLGPSA